MRKSLLHPALLLLGLFSTSLLHAQNTFPASGNVGIGTSSPQSKLDVISSGSQIGIRVSGSSSSYIGSDISITRSYSLPSVGRGPTLQFNNDATSTTGAIIQSSQSGGMQFFTLNDGVNWVERMCISNSTGNIGIGTANPQTKLSVNGTITTQEVNVTNTGWADYVFKSGYNLPSLDVVSMQIKSIGHLPGMPSAEENSKNGLKLGAINKLQQQKIEELTLYLIKQNNQIKRLEEENKRLKQSFTENVLLLSQKIETLDKKLDTLQNK